MAGAPRGIANTHTLTDIANAIRSMNGENWRYVPSQLAAKVQALSGDGDRGGMQYPYSDTKYGEMSMEHYVAVANAIRGQNGETREYKPSEMADAIRALEWEQTQAYAVAIPSASDSTKYELHFTRGADVPAVGDKYLGKAIAYVYKDFEDANFTSNSQVPWYPQHDDFNYVSFDDVVKPATCAYMFYMFRNCLSMNLANLDTSRVTSMAFMFYYCSSLTNLFLHGFDTSNVTTINYMFYFCTKLTMLVTGAWDMTNLKVVAQAFRNLSSIEALDFSYWTMPEWTSTMQYAFYNCANLTTIYVPAGCDLSDTSVNSYCFSQCTKLKGGNGTAYSSSNVTAAMARVDGLNGQPGYFTAV